MRPWCARADISSKRRKRAPSAARLLDDRRDLGLREPRRGGDLLEHAGLLLVDSSSGVGDDRTDEQRGLRLAELFDVPADGRASGSAALRFDARRDFLEQRLDLPFEDEAC